MWLTYEDLKSPIGATAIKATALAVMRSSRIPVDSWDAGSEPDALVGFDAEALAMISTTIAEIAKQGVLEDAEGPGLVQHAKDFYDENPLPEVATEGTVSIANATSSETEIGPGSMIIVADTADGQLVYRNAETVTIAPSTSTPVRIVAEAGGDRHNVNGARLHLTTPVPGWTMTAASGQGWITKAGSKVETDRALRTRCRRKVGAIPLLDGRIVSGGDGFEYLACTASAEVNRITVVEDPYADPALGEPAVRIIVASRTGPVSDDALRAVAYAINRSGALGTTRTIETVTRQPFPLRGTLRIRSDRAGGIAAAEDELDDAIEDFFAEQPIGDAIATAQLVAAIMALPGVVDVVLEVLDGGTWRPIAEVPVVIVAGGCVATAAATIAVETVTV